jgi:hypothetical protein
MNIWGKWGKEYYSWHIENIDELEAFIIEHDIDVDYVEESFARAFDKHWYSLKYQINGWYFRTNGNRCLSLVSFSRWNGAHQSFTAIKAVIF